ncbi:MAG: hypothetical protein AB1757_24280 [Acidobacteriota bacterium]
MIRPSLGKAMLLAAAFVTVLGLSSTSRAATVVLEGEISGKLKLKAKNTYILVGGVFINNKLVVKPGTTILGTEGSFLVIRQGAQIIAEGTADAPIVFSSVNKEGQRARGDWGGLIISGRAPINVPGGTAQGEGGTGAYGGNDPADNSGIMKYVRIEYGGFAISPDNELNCLAFQGVGNAGEFDFIQSAWGGDDAFEWFGGTANAKHLVATGADDDNFDWTFGWTGKVQFGVVQQRSDTGDTGIEADNNENGFDFLPRAAPKFANITLVGSPATGPGSRHGMVIRRGTAGDLRNFIVTGFKNVGLEVRDAATFTQLNNGALSFNGFIFNFNGNALATPANFAGQTADMLNAMAQDHKIVQLDPQLRDPFNLTAPDFRPLPTSPALNAANVAAGFANDPFFTTANYVGAFDATTDWTAGWTKWVYTR